MADHIVSAPNPAVQAATLVLVRDGSGVPAQRPAAMRAIAAKLGAAADVSYAEPNMTAHPGEQ